MDLEDEEVSRFSIDTTLEVKIKDFTIAKQTVSASSNHKNNEFEIRMHAMVSLCHSFAFRYTGRWRKSLKVSVASIATQDEWLPYIRRLSYTVSIVDIDGNSRLPRSYEGDGCHEYLKRSFILERADEFLPQGVLTLRFDIYLSWRGLLRKLDRMLHKSYRRFTFFNLPWIPFDSIPQSKCFNKEGTHHDFTCFDFTSQILTLPQFHETRKRFGVYGVPPCTTPSSCPGSQLDDIDVSEHIWIFDTDPDRFILSLKEKPGFLILETSDVIRQCVNAAMKERRENRIDLSHVDSHTFKMLLLLFAEGRFPVTNLQESVRFYEFCHLYQIESVRQQIVDLMFVDDLVPGSFEELWEIASLYSDEYFLNKLDEYQKENIIPQESEFEERADSECFI